MPGQFRCNHGGCKNLLPKTATEPGPCRRHKPGWKPKSKREAGSKKGGYWQDAMQHRVPGSFEMGRRR